MDISGISTSVSARSYLASSTASSSSEQVRQQRKIGGDHHHHDHHDRGKGVGRRGSALGAFKQELHLRLNARFDAKYSATQKVYAEAGAPDTAEKVAANTVGDAKQIAAESPTKAAKSLISFRAVVRETQSYVRESLGESEDYSELDDAVAKVDDALTELEDAASQNVVSSASLLAVDTSSKQRSTIRIRTQEGDTVRLSLRSSSRLSATDAAFSSAGNSGSVTEVELSSQSRLSLRIEGDLNDSELAAIQNVFAQAEKIANEFFDGDIGAAFNLAEGFEFDTEQLARVKLGFQSREVTRISYAESVRVATNPVAVEAPLLSGPTTVEAPVSDVRPADVVAATTVPKVTEIADERVPEQTKQTEIAASALSSFFDTLSTFLRSVGEGFTAESSSGSFRFHYSESFKLELLKAVVHTIAPQESEQAAASASAVINAAEEGLEA